MPSRHRAATACDRQRRLLPVGSAPILNTPITLLPRALHTNNAQIHIETVLQHRGASLAFPLSQGGS